MENPAESTGAKPWDYFDSAEYRCTAVPRDPFIGGRVTYEQFRGQRAVEGYKARLELSEDLNLPSKMGIGSVAHRGGATGWAYWRCDETPVYSEFTYEQDSSLGRNPAEDVTALLKIAQKRFAKLEGCEIRRPKT